MQQVVRLGRDVDLAGLPLTRQWPAESGRFDHGRTVDHARARDGDPWADDCPLMALDQNRLAIIDDGQSSFARHWAVFRAAGEKMPVGGRARRRPGRNHRRVDRRAGRRRRLSFDRPAARQAARPGEVSHARLRSPGRCRLDHRRLSGSRSSRGGSPIGRAAADCTIARSSRPPSCTSPRLRTAAIRFCRP